MFSPRTADTERKPITLPNIFINFKKGGGYYQIQKEGGLMFNSLLLCMFNNYSVRLMRGAYENIFFIFKVPYLNKTDFNLIIEK